MQFVSYDFPPHLFTNQKTLKHHTCVAQELVGPFCQDYLDVDYAFQLPAAYFIQQKDSTFNSFISLSF